MADERDGPSEDAVYAAFGRTAAVAQELEAHLKTIGLLAETLRRYPSFQWPSDPAAPPVMDPDSQALVRSRTLGQIVEYVASRLNLVDDRKLRLEIAVGYRNHLMHHFFPSKRADLLTETGRRRMLEALEQYERCLRAAVSDVDQLGLGMWRMAGIEEHHLTAWLKEAVEKALNEDE